MLGVHLNTAEYILVCKACVDPYLDELGRKSVWLLAVLRCVSSWNLTRDLKLRFLVRIFRITISSHDLKFRPG